MSVVSSFTVFLAPYQGTFSETGFLLVFQGTFSPILGTFVAGYFFGSFAGSLAGHLEDLVSTYSISSSFTGALLILRN